MLIYAIDDEPKMLKLLHSAIAEAEPGATVMDFGKASEVLAALTEQGRRPDVVFSDIALPGMDGLELAVRIKNASPDTKIVFVSGFPHYAADAYRLHANGFIVKPVEAGRVREELDILALPQPAARTEEPEKLRVQCFGYFEVFWQDVPLIFARAQTKELFAYLIDRNGAACTGGEIITALWGDNTEIKNPKPYLRVLTQDLRAALASVNMDRVLIRAHNQWAVRKELLDCDYYRLLEGDPAAINAYRGEYMKQFSWAELTTAELHFQNI